MTGFSNLYERLLNDLTNYVYEAGEKDGNGRESITGILTWEDKCRYYKVKNKNGIIYIELQISLRQEGNEEKTIKTEFKSINDSNLSYEEKKIFYKNTVKEFLEINNICK